MPKKPNKEKPKNEETDKKTEPEKEGKEDSGITFETGTGPIDEAAQEIPPANENFNPEEQGNIGGDIEGSAPPAILETSSAPQPTDKNGHFFDKNIHKFNPNTGEPVLTSKGKLTLKPGRKLNIESNINQAPIDRPVQFRQTAVILVSQFLQVNQLIFGQNYAPQKDTANNIDEKEMLITATEDYCRMKNLPDLPPGLALVCVVGAYYGARLTLPETKSKLSGAKNWIKSLFKRKGKKDAGRDEGTHADNRHDGEREIDPLQKGLSEGETQRL